MIYGPRQVGLLGLGFLGPWWNVRGLKACCASGGYQMVFESSSRVAKHHVPCCVDLQNLWSYMIYGPRQVGLHRLGILGPRWNVQGLKACCATQGYQMTLETSSGVSRHHIPCCHPLLNPWFYMISWPRQVGVLGLRFFGPRWNVRGLKACCATWGYQMTFKTSSRVAKHFIPYCRLLENLWLTWFMGLIKWACLDWGFLDHNGMFEDWKHVVPLEDTKWFKEKNE